MWSSFRSHAIAAAACVLAVTFAREACAQTYVIPSVELSSEYHTNRELNAAPGQADPMTGYIATAQALIGKRTQRSQTELRPRVRFQEYPDRSGVDPVDLFLDLQSDFRVLKGTYQVVVNASRQDTFNAEYGLAGVDTSGPETPDSHNDTGIVFVGNTRTEFRVRPSMDYALSERTRFVAGIGYDKVNYEETTAATREDYTDLTLETLLKYQLRPLADIEVGPYVSRYEASQNANRTDSVGVSLAWSHEVTEVSHMEVRTSVERTKIDDPTLSAVTENETNWAAEFKGYTTGRASRLDYGVGRYLAPSGLGSKVRRDELRLQYLRQMTPRFDWRGALRGGSEERLGFSSGTRDRNYVRGEFFVRWFMTQTFYVSGGYRYAWQKYKSLTDDADDNAALLLFGFRGLDIRRSAARGAP